MISFDVDSVETAQRVLEKVRVITFAESLGGTESLITYPMKQTHPDVPKSSASPTLCCACPLDWSMWTS